MGIRHLYTHLSPYAQPETFPRVSITPIYIDGPALCHHIYHHLFSSVSTSGNAFETSISYSVLGDAYGSYLTRLERAGFEIKKIFFDAALPSSKLPTRLSRLDDNLGKLTRYRSLNPTLRAGCASHITSPSTFFTGSRRQFHARTQHLSAPPFIVAAVLSYLAAHAVYSQVTETVPGEADSFLGAAAVRYGGIVLTGDSDLLVFSGGEHDWGVVMLQDLTFTDSGANARVFRAREIEKMLKFPMLDIAYQTSLDGQASFSSILTRLERVQERRRQGVGQSDIPEEFKKEYHLPTEQQRGRVLEEPRIGELLFQREKGIKTGRRMFLPFLNEDSQRSPAWDIGAEVRRLAYSILFENEGEVKEIYRRGQRITESVVECYSQEETKERISSLELLVAQYPSSWWAVLVLFNIVDSAKERGQKPNSGAELAAVAKTLLPKDITPPERTRQKWTWPLVQLFAMSQAGWYSLLLLREVLVYCEAKTTAETTVETGMATAAALREGLKLLPDVLRLFDTQQFLAGFENTEMEEKELAKVALARFWAVDADEAAEEEQEDQEDKNGNGKRPSDEEEWTAAETKKGKKQKKKKQQEKVVVDSNPFAALGMM